MLEKAPDVTRLIDRLEQTGLAERGRAEKDRRLSVSRITRKGINLLDRLQPRIDEVYQYFAERVSLADRRELSRICEGIYDEDE
jgi:DNA-binding MarR family transcriptional regulator